MKRALTNNVMERKVALLDLRCTDLSLTSVSVTHDMINRPELLGGTAARWFRSASPIGLLNIMNRMSHDD